MSGVCSSVPQRLNAQRIAPQIQWKKNDVAIKNRQTDGEDKNNLTPSLHRASSCPALFITRDFNKHSLDSVAKFQLPSLYLPLETVGLQMEEVRVEPGINSPISENEDESTMTHHKFRDQVISELERNNNVK